MISKLENFHLRKYRLIILTLLSVPVFLTVDSQYGDSLFFDKGQYVTLLLVFLAFIYAYNRSVPRVKNVMLIGIFVGMAGEVFFSLVMGMYHYRLGNVPLWLAFGHGLIFAVVFKLSHNPVNIKYKDTIQNILLIFAILYGFSLLLWADDWFGFVCTIAFIVILFNVKKSRLFFLIMFTIICYVEQIGTATGCWYWPEAVLSSLSWFPSGNPPSGVAVFYFLFDAIVFYVYLSIMHPKTKQRYKRITGRVNNISKEE